MKKTEDCFLKVKNDYLKFLKGYGIHPVDVIDKIIQKSKSDEGEIGKLYSEFVKVHHETEHFDTYDELNSYWQKKSNFDRLENGEYGKLNSLYTFEVVLRHREDFKKLLLDLKDVFIKNYKINNLKDFSTASQ